MAAGHPPSLGRIAYEPIPDIDRFDHIIVDEAQDVSPIEWNVLDQYLARDGQWTLVGDINQRRSDTTSGSWQEIADHLVLGDGDSAFDIQPMRRGYRSTGPILRFADKLLPASQRGGQSIQTDGPPVITAQVRTAGQLLPKVVELAAGFSAKHGEGTTAIITMDPGAVRRNSASLAGGSRDEKRSSGRRTDFRFATTTLRTHVDLSSTPSWLWNLEPSPRTSRGRLSAKPSRNGLGGRRQRLHGMRSLHGQK